MSHEDREECNPDRERVLCEVLEEIAGFENLLGDILDFEGRFEDIL